MLSETNTVSDNQKNLLWTPEVIANTIVTVLIFWKGENILLPERHSMITSTKLGYKIERKF